jgi:type I restriction enzyme S subunit
MMELGEIPVEWDVTTLGNTANYFVDGDWIELPHIKKSGIRLIQTGNIGIGNFKDNRDKRKYISLDSFNELKCHSVYSGDILICRLADPIGRCCIVPPKFKTSITSVDVTIYRINDNVANKSYIVHYLNDSSTLARMAAIAGGSTRQRISRKNLEKLIVPLPPLPEQQKIASILSSVDETIEETEALIEKYQHVKKGLMSDLLTKGVDEVGCVRSEQTYEFKDSVLGRVPVEWNVDILINSTIKITDIDHKMPNKVKNGIPFVAVKDIIKYKKLRHC